MLSKIQQKSSQCQYTLHGGALVGNSHFCKARFCVLSRFTCSGKPSREPLQISVNVPYTRPWLVARFCSPDLSMLRRFTCPAKSSGEPVKFTTYIKLLSHGATLTCDLEATQVISHNKLEKRSDNTICWFYLDRHIFEKRVEIASDSGCVSREICLEVVARKLWQGP